jgi:hypothetical protein
MEFLCEQNDPAYWATFQKHTRNLVNEEKKRRCTAIQEKGSGSPP